MEIINLKKVGSSHSMQSWPDHLAVPDGWAIVSDELDRSVFYDHNGFVILATTVEERVTGSHMALKENEDGTCTYATVEDIGVVTVVTAWEPNLEDWEEWKANRPAPKEPEPSTEERLAAVEETTAQQGEILNILLSGETGAGV